MAPIRAVLLDIDGTLVDSNDAHAHAWGAAFAEAGHTVPFERVRPLIGMGSDQLLPRVLGVEGDSPEGERLGDRWAAIFKEHFLPCLRPFPGSRALLLRMREDGLRTVAASSAREDLLGTLLDLAGVADLMDERTSSSDAERSKPRPDILQVAIDRVGLSAAAAVMIGDTPYDVAAAGKAGVWMIALRCGGWGDADFAGALAVYDDPADLLARYDESPLGGAARA